MAAPTEHFALPIHGGDLAAAEARFGMPAEGWLDLSTGINPQPYPIPMLAGDLWHRLPDSGVQRALTDAAASYFGVLPAQLVAASGTQALIQALPLMRPAGRVSVVAPTYAEHAAAWAAAGHLVSEGLEWDDAADVIIVVRPNNPDGRLLDRFDLLRLAERQHAKGGWLIVDEAFVDTVPQESLAPHLCPGLILLRSFGKFFGLAGVRLGFALADEVLCDVIRCRLGPWAVGGPALAIGAAAMSDRAWIDATIERLESDATALDQVLMAHGLSILGGTSLFRLVGTEHARALYEHLGRSGILVRAFAWASDRLRFGLPACGGGLRRLDAALASWAP